MPAHPPPTMGLRPGEPGAMGPASGAITFDNLAEIAVGATARVDLCRVLPPHPRAGQLLAIKRLHPHIAEDPTFANQFFDEAWMTASLKHPNVVEVAGWGTDPQGSYLAVELVQGVSLLRLMKTIFETGEAFTERMVVYIGARVCHGLAAAHALRSPNGEFLNLVHRDLTPGNILVGFNGDLKIADFGMAKAKQRLTKTLTGMRKGEPTYMAPEQAQRDDIDARADLFSLGVMLFELFAGRRPWIAKNDFDMVQVTIREPAPDLREMRPKIDKELAYVVSRCLEKDPQKRFQSAHEIAARLDEWLTLHGYQEGNEDALARFVRRNAMRQMRWFERAVAGEMTAERGARDVPPRVPTYTEHTAHPGRPSLPSDSAATDNSASTAKQIPSRPPPAARPADPRAMRAQNAVQALKKLAPPVEPPRAKRRMPTLDEDGDATDVELKQPPGLAGYKAPPRIDEAFVDEDGGGEEAPTLVQKGDAQLQAMRAEVRKAREKAAPGRSKPGYVSPGLIVDEESDQRITAVKQEEQQRAAGKLPSIIADHDSELPTEPKRPGTPLVTGQDPITTQRAKTMPGRPVIPPSPNVPQLPFAPSLQAAGSPRVPQMPPQMGRPRTAPPPPLPPPPVADAKDRSGRITARPPPPPPPASDPSRMSQPDEVQVIDRAALQQIARGGPSTAPTATEESLTAEADRLAIEAVRRGEEARAAQARAERKAAAAKLASDAALIASDAVRLVRTAGLAAALKRLEEARQVEQTIQSGKFPSGDASGPQQIPSFASPSVAPPATSAFPPPPSSGSGHGVPSYVPPPTPSAPNSIQSTLASGTPSYNDIQVNSDPSRAVVYLSSATPAPTQQLTYPQPPPSQQSVPPARPSFFPPEPQASAVALPAPPPHAQPISDEAFRAQLKPGLLSTPGAAMAALAGISLLVVVVLILLLAK